jgi:hypothetical protein
LILATVCEWLYFYLIFVQPTYASLRTYGGKFDYSGLSIASTSTGVTVTFKVANLGTQKATEIAQLYLGFPASAGEPPKNLRGFEEVPLAVGASSTVTLKLSALELRYGTQSPAVKH